MCPSRVLCSCVPLMCSSHVDNFVDLTMTSSESTPHHSPDHTEGLVASPTHAAPPEGLHVNLVRCCSMLLLSAAALRCCSPLLTLSHIDELSLRQALSLPLMTALSLLTPLSPMSSLSLLSPLPLLSPFSCRSTKKTSAPPRFLQSGRATQRDKHDDYRTGRV